MKNLSTFCRAWRDMCEDGRAHILTMAMLFLVSLLFCGCRNTGTYAVVGELDAPVDISDGSDTINVRALFSLTGAKVWSAKNSRVEMTYTNCYTNAYLFGMVEKRGKQDFGVKVDPTVDEAEPSDREGETDAEEPPPDAAPNKEVTSH